MNFSAAKWILFQLSAIAFIVLLFEIALRIQGYQPGNIQPNWLNFKTVDSLVEIHDFVTNSEGVFVANPAYFSPQNLHVNDWGFRFNKSKLLNTKQKRVMLIGDSFAWGLSATSTDSCYADLLQQISSCNVFNFGIPAADPVQYAAIAEKYFDSIQPDVVLLTFYLANDVMLHDRNIQQKPFYYNTNAGAILATDGDIFFPSAKEAYEHYAFKKYRISEPQNVIEVVALNSALLSRIYALKYRWHERQQKQQAIASLSITKKYLHRIDAVAAARNVPFIIAVIPEYTELAWYRTPIEQKYAALFQDSIVGKKCFLPELNAALYYPYPDAHFNNKGHAVFAQFLKSLLESTH